MIYCDILWYTVLYCGILWYTVIYCTILWYTVLLWYTVVYCGILRVSYRILSWGVEQDGSRMIIAHASYSSIFPHSRNGYISLEDYMSFMISRETENIESISEVVSAFRAITSGGDKPYVTKEEILQVHDNLLFVVMETYLNF